MARSARGPHRYSARQFRKSPYPLPAYCLGVLEKEGHLKKPSKTLEKKDWEDATCSVCMEFPHNAVLLLCSSHDRGCHPYMCGTSYRYSNCLNLYKKAYTKVLSPGSQDQSSNLSAWRLNEKSEVTELSCPLCRGQVKGWTVVEPARQYLNAKKRSCMQVSCSFVGTYKELRKHMKSIHPSAKPREVDPVLEQKWRRFEHEREHEDVISVIRSSIPGAVVWGDYVIEGGNSSFASDEERENTDRDGNDGGVRDFDPSIFYVLSLVRAFQNSRGARLAAPRLRRVERASQALEREDGGGRHFPLSLSGASDETNPSAYDWDDDDDLVDDDGALIIRQGRDVQSAGASEWDARDLVDDDGALIFRQDDDLVDDDGALIISQDDDLVDDDGALIISQDDDLVDDDGALIIRQDDDLVDDDGALIIREDDDLVDEQGALIIRQDDDLVDDDGALIIREDDDLVDEHGALIIRPDDDLVDDDGALIISQGRDVHTAGASEWDDHDLVDDHGALIIRQEKDGQRTERRRRRRRRSRSRSRVRLEVDINMT